MSGTALEAEFRCTECRNTVEIDLVPGETLELECGRCRQMQVEYVTARTRETVS